MKAILLEEFGGPEVLRIKEVEKPEPKDGFVLIRIKAFGLNHAETHMRKGEWAEWMPIIGVECVGIVEVDPTGQFKPGEAVASFMGGLGRTINGSYAEYTNARADHVFSFGHGEPPLPWEQLAVIPESYATAWTCIYRNLELQNGQTLLIRGASSALGKAAVDLALHVGAKITATVRSPDRAQEFLDLGVEKVEMETPDLAERLNLAYEDKFDAVLEFVGNSTVISSLTLLRRGGRLCMAGWLGGLAPIAELNPLLQMASGVHWSFFGSFHFGSPGFPATDVPLGDIVKLVAEGKIQAKPSKVFKFEDISEAHRIMDAGQAKGKLVVLGY